MNVRGDTASKSVAPQTQVQEPDMHPMHLSLTQPKSILVATDLSDLGFLLPVAIDQAKMTGAMIWLLHVVPPAVYTSTESRAYPYVPEERMFRDAEAALAKAAFELQRKNLVCAYEVRRWYPVDQVTDFIRQHGIERLILGTSSRRKLGKLLLGSVAEELIRSLDIPVCTVGPHFKPLPENSPHRVIFATSLRHHPEETFRFAVDLSAGLLAELTVLHVREQDRLDDGIDAGARPTIDEMLKGAKQMHLVPHIRIRSGEPAEEILSECSALRPELLVLGALPASLVSATFRTGVAYRVIAQAPCPTFTLRSGSKTKHNGNGREFSAVQSGSSHSG
jgi:nucleotide-binding universal stress UspA family protein